MPKGPGFIPCTACGGSGAVTVQEIVPDGKGGFKTIIVRRICSVCGGSGGRHI